MASETCYKHYNFGDKGFLSINDMCDEDCINASLKCQPLFLHGKFVAPSSHNLSNGYGEKGHDSDHFNRELKLGMQDIDVSRVTCQGTQENGNADDSSILAIRKSRTNLIAVVEVPKEVISKVDDQTKESKKHESLCLPESGMIDLTSANSMFMQSRSLNAEPLYTHRQLPKFLQESLEQSLSRLTITIRDDKLLEEKSIVFMDYTSEEQLLDLTALITKDLSEPYSIYTYRYFLHNWPHLSFLAYCDDLCVGSIVCKLDQHRKDIWRGYIAMLAVHKDFRRFKIGTKLVQKAIRRMIEQGCDEIVLETEVTNKAALNLYENLGFIRDKRLLRYYLNGVDAWRLKLWLV